ncbi:MAG TPA: LPS export ABC transporter periplasmic protein LptC, partial [Bryobacteraceae bacterium]|nr:LPS export ABC transporter periplasmic protein LptC [Bryobacteraceae bacterium]
MRSLRWLLLAAILVVTAGLFAIYRNQSTATRGRQRAVPPSLANGTIGNAQEWEWGQSAEGKPAVKLKAKNSTQTDNNHTVLDDLELRIYMKDAKHFDRVRSPKAEFSTLDNKLYSPGEAEITLGVPSEGAEPGTLTIIKAAAVNFDSQSGEAGTTQPVAFAFSGGTGTAVGASYNPTTHQLHLTGGVTLNLQGKKPGSKAMKVESAELTYSEADSQVHLEPWSKLTRGETTMSGGPAVIHMKDKQLDTVDTVQVSGTDKRPGRELEYTAASLHVQYNEDHDIEKLNGSGGAKLIAHGNGATTSMTGQTVDLFFNTETGDSELATAIAKGGARIESKPNPDPKGQTGDTKIVLSELLNLHMKPGGRDLDRVDTPIRATLEFLPATSDRHRRILRSSDMDIRYGDKSAVQSFKAANATTETYPSADEKQKRPTLAVSHTSSKLLDASFDENSEIRLMKQLGDFRYDQGTRKAQATNGILENEKDLMTLDGAARVSDETGSTAADHIELHQETGDFDARGHVATTRLPEAKKTGDVNAGSDMLDKEEPTQG